jgi:hypothetical protein
MSSGGIYTLCALSIGAAISPPKLISPIEDLDGMGAVTLEANFQYGAGSGSVSPIVVTSFDGGVTWRQIARFDFGNVSRVAVATLTMLASKVISTYADLASEGLNDGMLGDRLAVLLGSTGAYTNTVLSIRASVLR